MAQGVLLLCGAAVVAAASYADYSGARMPQYGLVNDYEGPQDSRQSLDKYHPYSPEATVSEDYKLDDESRYKTTHARDLDDEEGWRKPIRKHRSKTRPQQMDELEHKYERENDLHSLRTSHRHTKHRPRLKGDELLNEKKVSKISSKYNRDKNEDFSDNIYIDKDEFPDDKSKDFEDTSKFNKIRKFRRTVRRKPRDKILKGSNIETGPNKMRGNNLETNDVDDMDVNKEDEDFPQPILNVTHHEHSGRFLPDHDENDTPEVASDIDSGRDSEGPRQDNVREDQRELGRNAPVRDWTPRHHQPIDEEDVNEPIPGKKSQPFDELENYYDMKRIHGYKTKQPSLSRRTMMWTSKPDIALPRDSPDYYNYETPQDSGGPSKDLRKYFDAIGPTIPHHIYKINRPTKGSSPADNDINKTPPTLNIRLPSVSVHTDTETLNKNTWKPIFDHDIDKTNTSSEMAAITVFPTAINGTGNSTPIGIKDTAMSLAKQSMLSILKKAHRKEQLPIKQAVKPPVLLQVTQQIPTVVMLEPPGSNVKAKEVPVDSPERIEKIKKLFRHKLLVRAKDIRELTDNWNSLVCDYVDLSMLDNAARKPAPLVLFIVSCTTYFIL